MPLFNKVSAITLEEIKLGALSQRSCISNKDIAYRHRERKKGKEFHLFFTLTSKIDR